LLYVLLPLALAGGPGLALAAGPPLALAAAPLALADDHGGQCPLLGPGTIGSCIETCTGDSSCPSGQKCCSNGCGHTCQASMNSGGGGSVHPGQCPVPSGGISSCIATCSGDSSCAADEKCCSTGCGITCQKAVRAGQCPLIAPSTRGSCIEACTGDGSCPRGQKCCSNGCGHTCQAVISDPHPGQCPVVKGGPAPCLVSCTGDASCPQNEKCCSNGCGRTCQKTVSVHAGQCPRPGGGISSCLATCSDDSSCPSDQKCCSTGCGLKCQPVCRPLPCPAIMCPANQQQMQYDENGCPTCPKCTGQATTCSVDSDCHGKQKCLNGRCRANGKGPCQNGICPAGQHCVNNVCRMGSS